MIGDLQPKERWIESVESSHVLLWLQPVAEGPNSN